MPPVSSCESNELTEFVITRNSCSVGSPKEVSNAVNVSMSGASVALNLLALSTEGQHLLQKT